MSMAIDDLMNEHEAVIFALNVLDKINHRQKSDPGNTLMISTAYCPSSGNSRINATMARRKDFIPRHGKPWDCTGERPIGEMLEEHELGRKLVREMGSASMTTPWKLIHS